jgi:hypothetical protein
VIEGSTDTRCQLILKIRGLGVDWVSQQTLSFHSACRQIGLPAGLEFSRRHAVDCRNEGGPAFILPQARYQRGQARPSVGDNSDYGVNGDDKVGLSVAEHRLKVDAS